MKHYYHFTKLFLLSLVLLCSVGLVKTAQAADPGTVNTCLAPTSLDAYVNPFGVINFSWLHGANTSEFVIQVLPSGETCGSANVIKEITVPGTTSWYVLPADLSCGLRTLCVKANCCNDRCDSCQNLVGQNEDYCSAMSGLYTNRCACKDQNSMPVIGSFKYKCSAGGTVVLQNTPCADPTKNIGCTWDCKVIDSTALNKCGLDYDVQCGKGPDGAIVGAKPSFDLCSVSDSRGYKPDASYLVNPPGVYPEPGTNLIYRWKCLGAKTSEPDNSCKACRRAMCSTEFQGKVVTGDFSKTKLDQLCRDNGDITATATKPAINPATGKWEWDCIGNESCGTNRNHVVSFMEHGNTTYSMLDHCSAEPTGCGWANGVQVTYDTWQKNGGSEIASPSDYSQALGDFWCLNGGRVESVNHNDAIHQKSGVKDILQWQCVYDQPSTPPIICSAGLISCNPAINNKNVTKESFGAFAQPADIWHNLCLFGAGGQPYIKNFMSHFVQLANGGEALNGKFQWSCTDEFGGLTKCQAPEVACKQPPSGDFVKNIEALQPPLCTAGRASAITPVYNLNATGKVNSWYWDCLDDFGAKSKPQCQAQPLACATPPHDKGFNGWADFAANGVSCSDPVQQGAQEKANCTGICTKKDLTVAVTLDTNSGAWNWTCGEDVCKARIADCAKPPQGAFYKSLEDFMNAPNLRCDLSYRPGEPANCCGVCTEQGEDCNQFDYSATSKATKVAFDGNKFSWTCGVKTCESERKCEPDMTWDTFRGIDAYEPEADFPEVCAEKTNDSDYNKERRVIVYACKNPTVTATFDGQAIAATYYGNAVWDVYTPKREGRVYTLAFPRKPVGDNHELKVTISCADECAKDFTTKTISKKIKITENKQASDVDLQVAPICSGANRKLKLVGKTDTKCDAYAYRWEYSDGTNSDNAEGCENVWYDLNDANSDKRCWWFTDGSASYEHQFTKLTAGKKIKVFARCIGNGTSCIDSKVANSEFMVEQGHKADSVKIADICIGDNKPMTATASGATCSTFEYRWTINGAVGNWSLDNKFNQQLNENDEVKVEARCADVGACNDDSVLVSDTKTMEKNKKIDVVSIVPGYACTAYEQKLSAKLGAGTTCTNVEYHWKKSGEANWSAWSSEAEYSPASALKAGQKVDLEARCTDPGACVEKAPVGASEVTVKLSETIIADPITGYDKAICAGDEVNLTAHINSASTCDDVKYQWYLNDQAINGATASTLRNDFEDGAKIKVRLTCADDAAKCPPVPNFDDSSVVTIKADPKVALSLDLTKVPDVQPICAGKELSFTCRADGMPQILKDKLQPVNFAWTWVNSLAASRQEIDTNDDFAKAWKSKFTIPNGLEKVDAKVTCAADTNYHCAAPKNATKTVTVPVIACGCGVADKSTHTAAYWNDQVAKNPSFLCRNGGDAELVGPNSTASGWSWSCKYPDGSKSDCSATEAKCGDLGSQLLPNGKVAVGARKYTTANWSDKAVDKLCIGTEARNDKGLIDSAKIDEVVDIKTVFDEITDDYAGGLVTGRKWYCVGDSDEALDKLSCGNFVVDCGTADAQRYDVDNKYIRPKTGNKYHGSFNLADGGVPEDQSMRCLNANYSNYVANDTRGAYTWNCGGDSDNNTKSVLTCAARKDCGWAGLKNNDYANAYATVYFNQGGGFDANSVGCWTADNIRNPDDAASTEMAWHRAIGVNDAAFYGQAGCGYNGCLGKITETTCPEGWSVPKNLAWNRLEASLDNPANTLADCSQYRLSVTNNALIWKCNPAANEKSFEPGGFGLKSQITFNGKAGEAYWTQTSACTQPDGPYNLSTDGANINYCPAVPNRQTKVCVGSTRTAGNYLQATPFYFQLSANDTVGRMTEDNWCAGTSANYYKTAVYTHQLRCIRNDTAATSIKAPETPVTPIPATAGACIGVGCYRQK